ncbi:unnamed protein product [Toxocara canis]|uniref:Sucrase-isomaltase, intestinal n=1 Tax=Toxocara canis TaxID=6265 RepID=A0A183TYG3_TOXCA|nr:unnamed protein product [Toxocara canis]
MLGTTGRGKNRQYDTKNLYGLYEAKATMRALHEVTQKRGVVVSRSMFPTAGRYAGHWLGDNQASWETLVTTIVGVQEFNMFGIPYVGSDICGYSGDTTEELCLRWHQLGAFHPFSRNHNNNNAVPQDPAQWPSVAAATREAYLFRYRYLPYLYSLHFAASRNGGTVVRPVFFEFPKDQKTLDLGMQFMWGSGLMIVPVIEKVHLSNPTTNSADGFFYWDDGDGIITDFGTYPYYEFHFTFTSNTQTSKLTITQISKGNIPMPTLDSIDILGLPHVPDLATVTYMGQNVDMSDSSYDASKQLFKIRRQGLMALDKQPYNAELVWSNEG